MIKNGSIQAMKAQTGPHISIAPMMDWTDRYCRTFHRLISPNVRLYTEMVTTGAILHGDTGRFLRYDEAEHPVALQLGGSDPKDLAASAKIGAAYGYDEINLNCGCPSDRVQKGRFGACLMAEPDLVAGCVQSMVEASSVPVTVKCRIGIDDQDDFAFLHRFVQRVSREGAKTFIIHARKAWLHGLSPKENREIPPLDFNRVDELKTAFPDLNIIVNGGIGDLGGVKDALNRFDGVMIGRRAYQDPWFLAELEEGVFNNDRVPLRGDIVRGMIPFLAEQNARFGTPVKSAARHMIGLYNGCRGARLWRQTLSNPDMRLVDLERLADRLEPLESLPAAA